MATCWFTRLSSANSTRTPCLRARISVSRVTNRDAPFPAPPSPRTASSASTSSPGETGLWRYPAIPTSRANSRLLVSPADVSMMTGVSRRASSRSISRARSKPSRPGII